MLNSSKPPFDDERMRRAYAKAIDMKTYNDLLNNGYSTIAQQPFPEGDLGYVDDPGYPEFDVAGAQQLVSEYVAGGGSAEFTLNVTSEPLILARAEVMQNMLAEVGVSVKLHSVDQATLINEAIAGQFQAAIWRAHPGGDPDSQYVWWRGEGNPTNFGRIEDAEINRLLDAGRMETDPEKRREGYEALSRRFAEKVWNIWLTYIEWAVALSPEVHGVMSAELPDEGGMPFTGLASGHPVLGLWITGD
jgi:peptide/nickel transport system substrate-binding protein